MFRTLAAALIAVTLVAIPSTPAVADTPGCVTRKEFRAIKDGWLKKRVERRFDTDGWVHHRGYKTISRSYETCSPLGPVYRYVIYTRDHGWRVTDKL